MEFAVLITIFLLIRNAKMNWNKPDYGQAHSKTGAAKECSIYFLFGKPLVRRLETKPSEMAATVIQGLDETARS